MPVIGTNTTGWTKLIDGNLIGAVYEMFNAAFVGYFVVALFLVYQFMLYLKVRNLMLNLITGLMFGSMFIASNLITAAALPIMYLILVLELAAIFFLWFMK